MEMGAKEMGSTEMGSMEMGSMKVGFMKVSSMVGHAWRLVLAVIVPNNGLR